MRHDVAWLSYVLHCGVPVQEDDRGRVSFIIEVPAPYYLTTFIISTN